MALFIARRLHLRHLSPRFSTTISNSTTSPSPPPPPPPPSLQNLSPPSPTHQNPNPNPPPNPFPSSGRFAVQLAATRLSASVQPNSAAVTREPFLSTVILNYGSAYRLDRAIATFEDIPRLTASPPTTLSFNALLSAAIRSRDLYQVPLLFYQLSSKHSISPDKISYGILVKSLCVSGKTDSAVEILKEMEAKGVEITAVVYTTLINSLYKENKAEMAGDLWNEMIRKGVIPDLAAYNVKIRNYALKGNLEAVLGIVSELRSAGLMPERTTYNYLMKCYSRNGRFEDVERVYEEMMSNGWEPNSTTFKIMMDFLCENGDFDGGFEVFKRSMNCNRVPEFLTLKNLVVGLAKRSRIEEAKMVIMVSRERFPANKVGGWKEVERKLGLNMSEKRSDGSP